MCLVDFEISRPAIQLVNANANAPFAGLKCRPRAHSHRNTASCAHSLLPLLPTFRLFFTFERFWGVVPSMHERRSVIIPRCALGFIAGLLEFPKPLTGIEFLPAKSGCSCRVVMVENHCKVDWNSHICQLPVVECCGFMLIYCGHDIGGYLDVGKSISIIMGQPEDV